MANDPLLSIGLFSGWIRCQLGLSGQCFPIHIHIHIIYIYIHIHIIYIYIHIYIHIIYIHIIYIYIYHIIYIHIIYIHIIYIYIHTYISYTYHIYIYIHIIYIYTYHIYIYTYTYHIIYIYIYVSSSPETDLKTQVRNDHSSRLALPGRAGEMIQLPQGEVPEWTVTVTDIDNARVYILSCMYNSSFDYNM